VIRKFSSSGYKLLEVEKAGRNRGSVISIISDSKTASMRPEPLPALTGLRLVGAGWVVLFHLQPTLYLAWPSLKFFEPVLSKGDYGVPLFFVLSGFIIWHNYGFKSLLTLRSSARFLWRRFARLWPVNIASLTLAIPVVWWGIVIQNNFGAPMPDWYSKIGWIKSAFMVQEIGRPEPVFAWNQPAWSLTAEMVAYIAFPVLLALLFAIGVARSRHRWTWALLAFVIAYLVQDRSWLFPSRWLVELFLIFTAGALLRIAGTAGRRLSVLAATVQILAPIAIVLVCYTQGAQFIVVFLGAWVWSLSAAKGPGVWFFSLRGLQIAGLSSYSVYMLHWVIFGYCYIFLYYHPAIKQSFLPLFVVGMLCAVGVASWVTWRFFETPARKILNQLFERVWRKKVSSTHLTAPAPPKIEEDPNLKSLHTSAASSVAAEVAICEQVDKTDRSTLA